jgi:nucleotide sugar dehydrogenase
MNVVVVGMGKIGLPLAVQYARKGMNVIGVDISSETIKLINSGIPPFPEEENLDTYLKLEVENGKLIASDDLEESVKNADVIVVVIPLFVDERASPDFSGMDKVTAVIGKNMRSGTLICYETTLPIGTTRDRFSKKIIEESGLKIGQDFYVVFSPERVLTGRVFSDLRRYPKIVGGVTPACTARGKLFYESVLDFDSRDDLEKKNGVWTLESAESAEFVKLAETTYRDVNIGLANEFASYAHKINLDIYEIIESANSQPYSHLHKPGISVGGHCIPIYPQFYMWSDKEAKIVSAARNTNSSMPFRAISNLEQVLGSLEKLNVLILGVSYRPNVKETAFSGALDLRNLLLAREANVYGIDPLYSNEEIEELDFRPWVNDQPIDVVILHTEHAAFNELDPKNFEGLKAYVDGRNFLTKWRHEIPELEVFF